MNFVIPCHVFARVAKAVLPADGDPGKHTGIRGVHVENINGISIAAATDRKLLIVEYLGPTNEPNGIIDITVDLLPACEARKDTDLNLIVAQTPGWSVATIGSEYFHPSNAEIPGGFIDWDILVPFDKPSKSNGAICFDAPFLSRLASLSPTGEIVLPSTYDVDKGIIVRDRNDDGWFGIFLAIGGRDQSVKPATLPAWYKRK